MSRTKEQLISDEEYNQMWAAKEAIEDAERHQAVYKAIQSAARAETSEFMNRVLSANERESNVGLRWFAQTLIVYPGIGLVI